MNVELLLKEYVATDTIAGEIISEKHQISEFDEKRNSTREALHQVKKLYPSVLRQEAKSWVCFGNTFIKMDVASCIEMLEKDHTELGSEIERLRQNLKPKVAALHHLEGRAEAKGFDLKGMQADELLTVGCKEYSSSS